MTIKKKDLDRAIRILATEPHWDEILIGAGHIRVSGQDLSWTDHSDHAVLSVLMADEMFSHALSQARSGLRHLCSVRKNWDFVSLELLKELAA